MNDQRVAVGPFERVFLSDPVAIHDARHFVRRHVSAVVTDAQRIDDIELATSELVTNAIEYGDHQPVTVAVDIAHDALRVSVCSGVDATDVAPPETWSGPRPRSRSGRGLMIVRSVSDSVAVAVDAGIITVTCTFDRHHLH